MENRIVNILNLDAEKIMASQCIFVLGVIDFCVCELVLTEAEIELVTELFAAETFLFIYERLFFSSFFFFAHGFLTSLLYILLAIYKNKCLQKIQKTLI